jgi:hypothetical protein
MIDPASRLRFLGRLRAIVTARASTPPWPDPWPGRQHVVEAEAGDPALVDRLRDAADATAASPERLASLSAPVMTAFRAATSTAAARERAGRATDGRWRRSGRPLATRLVQVAVMLVALATAGATALASSGPGQALYPARLSLESTLLVAFQGPGTGGRVTWLERRLDEAEAAARTGSDVALDSALGAYVDGLAMLARASTAADRVLAARLDTEITRLRVLEQTHDQEPPGAAAVVRQALHAAVALRRHLGGETSRATPSRRGNPGASLR